MPPALALPWAAASQGLAPHRNLLAAPPAGQAAHLAALGQVMLQHRASYPGEWARLLG